jgi:phage/plasmid-associated DNA primase
MDTELLNLLKSVSKEGHPDFNFISVWGPNQNYYIPQSNLDEFWYRYSKFVNDRIVADKPIKASLAERPQSEMPILVSGVLKFDTAEMETEYYQEDFILAIIKIFQETLDEYLEISDNKCELYCVVLENKVPYTEQNKKCIAFSIHFPYLKTDATIFGRNILHNAITKIREENVSRLLKKQPLNDFSDIFNSMSCMRPIPLYCSVVSPQQKTMFRNGIYGIVEKSHIENKSGPSVPLSEIFDPSIIKNYKKETVDFWLPYLLSINFCKKLTRLRVISRPTSTTKKEIRDEDYVGLFEELAPHLSISRVMEKHYWLDVGRCIYNIYHGSAEGLKRWIALSEQGDDFDENDCESTYYTLEGSYNTIKTIAWYVKEDNPEFYEKWRSEKRLNSMNNSLTGYDNDIARCLYQFYWLDFVYSGKVWYHFKDHRWKIEKTGVSLKRLMSDDLCKAYEKFRTGISANIANSDDIDVKGGGEAKMVKISSIISKLKNNTMKKKLLSEAEEFFGEVDYEYPFNKNSEILGLSNGVIEIVCSKAIFRASKPEDYVSMKMGVPLESYFSENHPAVIRLNKYLTQWFVDPELRNYFLKLSASKLRGRNIHKFLEVWSGETGNNGKSVLTKLFERVFGEYLVKMPTAIITSSKTSSGPTPELAQVEGTRIAYIQETAADKKLHADIIKQLTGGDSFFARKCNSDGGKIEALYKTILMCNKIARVDNIDQAIYNRLKIVPFLSEFTDTAPETEQDQYRLRKFKKNPDFDLQVGDLSRAFLWKIFNYYDTYIREGLVNPDIVVKVTNSYWSGSCPYSIFIEEQIKKVLNVKGEIDDSSSISWSELYASFSQWIKLNFPGSCPDRSVAITTFEEKLGKRKKGRFFGYILQAENA